MRSDLVVRTVPTEESHGDGLVIVLALVVEDGDGGRRSAPWRRDVQRGHLSEAGQLAKTSAANDSNRHRACEIEDRQPESTKRGMGEGDAGQDTRTIVGIRKSSHSVGQLGSRTRLEIEERERGYDRNIW